MFQRLNCTCWATIPVTDTDRQTDTQTDYRMPSLAHAHRGITMAVEEWFDQTRTHDHGLEGMKTVCSEVISQCILGPHYMFCHCLEGKACLRKTWNNTTDVSLFNTASTASFLQQQHTIIVCCSCYLVVRAPIVISNRYILIHPCILGDGGVTKDIFPPPPPPKALIIPACIVVERELRLAIRKATSPRNKIKNCDLSIATRVKGKL